MSSILRALKKLESEPGRQAGNEPLATALVPLADTGAAGSPAKTAMMVVGGGIVCGVVVLAGWFLLSEKTQAPSPAVQEAFSVPPPSHTAPDLIEAFGASLERNRWPVPASQEGRNRNRRKPCGRPACHRS